MDADNETPLKIGEALVWAFEELSKALVPEPRAEAEFILMHVLGSRRHELFLNARATVTGAQEAELRQAVARRVRREPAQYIFGQAEFRGLSFKVTRDVLIPRPETELLVGEAAKAASALEGGAITIIDLCTGSGCIAIAAAKEIEGSVVYATDISAAALGVARENAATLGAADRVSFYEGDLFAPLPDGIRHSAEMVLSNPPYIAADEIERLDPEVRDFEPRAALEAGPDGLAFIRRIVAACPEYLAPGGWLMLEMGYGQAAKAREATEESAAFTDMEILKDYAGIERILKARLKA